MHTFKTLAAAVVTASLLLTGCGSEDAAEKDTSNAGEGTSESTEAAEPEELDATSARALTEKLLGATDCSEPQLASPEEITQTNKDEGTNLLDSAFCGVEKPTRTAYFVSVSEDDGDFDKVADYFGEQMKSDQRQMVTEDVRGDGWQVLVIAQGELPADIDQQEEALKEAAGR